MIPIEQVQNRRKLDHYKQERESYAEEKKLEDDKLKVGRDLVPSPNRLSYFRFWLGVGAIFYFGRLKRQNFYRELFRWTPCEIG